MFPFELLARLSPQARTELARPGLTSLERAKMALDEIYLAQNSIRVRSLVVPQNYYIARVISYVQIPPVTAAEIVRIVFAAEPMV